MMRPVGDKVSRFVGGFAEIKAVQFLLLEEALGLDVFTHELKAFPNGTRDDYVDALSQFIEWQTSSGAGS